MALIRKEKIFCKIFDNINGGHSKEYNAALNWAATQIRKAEEAREILVIFVCMHRRLVVMVNRVRCVLR